MIKVTLKFIIKKKTVLYADYKPRKFYISVHEVIIKK